MPPEAPPWAYDAISHVYDDDMGPSAPTGDVEFYVEEGAAAGGSLLELGCGTGRITLPMLRAGLTVTAVDRSQPMLDVLAEKARVLPAADRDRLRLVRADMRELHLEARFDAVICPYSAFTYLVTASDRERALSAVRGHLRKGAPFVLDVFVPDPAIAALPDGQVIVDYERRRADGTTLRRSKTIAKNVEPGVNVIERRYRVVGPDGRETESFVTRSRVRSWTPDDLTTELERQGFAVDVIPDFKRADGAPVKTAVFRCRAL